MRNEKQETNPMQTTKWEFTGPATQMHFDACSAVATAMDVLGVSIPTFDALDLAAEKLAECDIEEGIESDWDFESVRALIDGCTFTTERTQ